MLRPFAFILAALVAPAAFATSGHAGHMTAAAAAAAASLTEGVVKKVDKAAGKITLSHGPLENLGMPGMTMAFAVKDPAWLERYKPGDKVRFVADHVNGVYTVVQMDFAR